MKPTIAVIMALAAIGLASCSSAQHAGDTTTPVPSGNSVSHKAGQAPSHTASAAPVAAPVTSSAVRATATAYFHLYGAGRYAATWPLLSPAARRVIPEQVWVKVHDECIRRAAGRRAYKVIGVELAGPTAVVNVSFAGPASGLDSDEQAFAYADGRWSFAPSDLSVYQGHTVAQAVAVLKAQGLCTG
jgi:hypothetical protein